MHIEDFSIRFKQGRDKGKDARRKHRHLRYSNHEFRRLEERRKGSWTGVYRILSHESGMGRNIRNGWTTFGHPYGNRVLHSCLTGLNSIQKKAEQERETHLQTFTIETQNSLPSISRSKVRGWGWEGATPEGTDDHGSRRVREKRKGGDWCEKTQTIAEGIRLAWGRARERNSCTWWGAFRRLRKW